MQADLETRSQLQVQRNTGIEGKLKTVCINHFCKADKHLSLSLAVMMSHRLGLGLRGKERKAKLTPMLISRSNGSRDKEPSVF